MQTISLPGHGEGRSDRNLRGRGNAHLDIYHLDRSAGQNTANLLHLQPNLIEAGLGGGAQTTLGLACHAVIIGIGAVLGAHRHDGDIIARMQTISFPGHGEGRSDRNLRRGRNSDGGVNHLDRGCRKHQRTAPLGLKPHLVKARLGRGAQAALGPAFEAVVIGIDAGLGARRHDGDIVARVHIALDGP